jgi:hypothetical protein
MINYRVTCEDCGWVLSATIPAEIKDQAGALVPLMRTHQCEFAKACEREIGAALRPVSAPTSTAN